MRPDRRRLLLFRHLYSFLRWLPGIVCLAGHGGKVLFANKLLLERLGDPPAGGLKLLLPPGPWSEDGRALSRDDMPSVPREWTRTLGGRACRMRGLPYREVDGSPVLLVLGVEADGPEDRDAALRDTCAAVERQVRGRGAVPAFPDLEDVQSRLSDLEARILRFREERIDLLESRDLHFDLFESAPVGCVDLDERGRILRLNRTAVAMAGLEGKRFPGMHFVFFVAPADKDRFYAHLRQCLAEDGRVSIELSLSGRGRGPVRVEMVSVPFREGRGMAPVIRSVITDITRSEEAAEALRRSNERLEERVRERTAALEEAYESLRDREADLSSFYDSAPMMMGIVEPVGDDVVYISGNEATARFFSTPREDPESAGPRGTGVPDPVTSLWLARYREAERTGYPVQFEYLHDARAEPRWLSATVARIGEGPEGRSRFCFVAEDVTDRKKAEEALKESEERFRTLVEHSLVGLFIVQEGQIVFMNPEQERIFGPLPEGFPVAAFSENVHPDDRETFRDWCEAVSSGDLSEDREAGIRFHPPVSRPGGRTLRWIHARTTPIRYRGRKAVLVNTVDITRFKELERAALVQEKMANLGQVAAGIAHEIRNPLSGLNIYLSSAERLVAEAEGAPEDARESLRAIFSRMKGASDKIGSIVRRVMGFARPEPLKLESVDVAVAIREAVQLAGVTVRRSGVRLDVIPCDGLPRCRADLHLLEQVLVNLITNAAQAMEGQKEERRIVFDCAEEDGYILVRVADSGPGVPEELRERIFEPMFTTKSGGTGIGLSFSHKIVADHGGTITVGASRWGGAEFRVRIPADCGREMPQRVS